MQNLLIDFLRGGIMPFEEGGRSDKDGNNYEDYYVVNKILDMILDLI